MKNIKTIAVLSDDFYCRNKHSMYRNEGHTIYEAYESLENALNSMNEELESFIKERIFVNDRIIKTYVEINPSADEIYSEVTYQKKDDSCIYKQIYHINIIDLTS